MHYSFDVFVASKLICKLATLILFSPVVDVILECRNVFIHMVSYIPSITSKNVDKGLPRTDCSFDHMHIAAVEFFTLAAYLFLSW